MNLEDIKGVGKVKKSLLNNLGIFTVKDLIFNKPRSYEDRRNFTTLRKAINQQDDKASLIKAKIINHQMIRGHKKKFLKLIISDGTLKASLVCFNRNFFEKTYPIGEEVIVFGKFQFRFDEAQSTSFEIIKNADLNNSYEFGKILPIYNLTEGLNQKFLRQITHYILSNLSKEIDDIIPKYIKKKRNLMNIQEALWQIHFPSDYESVIPAIKTVKYEELFNLQYNLKLKQYIDNKNQRTPFKKADLARTVIKELPFKLTKGQKHSLKQIKEDLFSNHPMNRLLQGDVGAGKTLVAMIAMCLSYENGYQSALMVPTEVLALQHYNKIKTMLKPYGIKVDVLYSSMSAPSKKLVLYNLKEGLSNFVIGTHSLFSENVEYKNLGLAVIDEQHKFGVRQRISLMKKGDMIHTLVMTATPIPRTLTMTLYGDMKTSVIRDKPAFRKVIKTKVLYQDERQKAVEFVKEQIEKGEQCYIIYPMIEDSEKMNLTSAVGMYEQLSGNEFSGISMGLLHGKLSTEEKKEIMEQFSNKDIQILVSTTVIEVGVDNPNATVIIVENAERFGLSQLHQLRGRVGRGEKQSYCYLLVNRNISDDGKERMRAMVRHHDGFEIAEEDLKIRGPGEFLGVRQSGVTDLKFADLRVDYDILKDVSEDCKTIIKNDPECEKDEHKGIKDTLYKRFEEDTIYYLNG